MATPSEKLAESLRALKKLQGDSGITAIRAKDITRTHRERLTENGFIREVIKGWYIVCRPGTGPGDPASWYTNYWNFCSEYLRSRFSNNWCLSPEESISIHAGNMSIPKQLLVRSPEAQNNLLKLLYGTSMLEVRLSIPEKNEIDTFKGINIYSLPNALISCSESYYQQFPGDIRTSLFLIKDSSEILRPLLEGGHSAIAGRLAGAFRNIGKPAIADNIIASMKAAGYDVREKDPFEKSVPLLIYEKERSPVVIRINVLWRQMRDTVIKNFPGKPDISKSIDEYLEEVEEVYKTDAYNSLSIEGYKVSQELIEKVRTGNWKPDESDADKEHKDALAARGYWQAFQSVKESIRKILNGQNAGEVVKKDHADWYRELFAPGVTAGILKPSDLAGYRNGSVFISESMHIPADPGSVRDAMPAFFDLLAKETESSGRAVLGHWIFVFLHPYPDGNGRIARFLMNAMLASGGYSWIVIPVEKRELYMESLEKASVNQNIEPFASFLASLLKK
ncbi:MAG: Fic family protein [Bacteroidales bacterium]|nr:Fic family protein [Bacteroidales bacterium]